MIRAEQVRLAYGRPAELGVDALSQLIANMLNRRQEVSDAKRQFAED